MNFTVREETLVLVKPDAVARGLVGDILARYERRGLAVTALAMTRADLSLAERHYEEHRGRPRFPRLTAFLCSGPLVAAVVQGPKAVAVVRATNGSTDPAAAVPGTVRGDLAAFIQDNCVHASGDPDEADREIGLWFPGHDRSSDGVRYTGNAGRLRGAIRRVAQALAHDAVEPQAIPYPDDFVILSRVLDRIDAVLASTSYADGNLVGGLKGFAQGLAGQMRPPSNLPTVSEAMDALYAIAEEKKP